MVGEVVLACIHSRLTMIGRLGTALGAADDHDVRVVRVCV